MRTAFVLTLLVAAATAQDGMPAGAIAYFEAPSCPAGWSLYGPANGRAVVPVAADNGILAQVGSPLSSGENRAHSHRASGTIGSGIVSYSFFFLEGTDNTSAARNHNFNVNTSGETAGIPYAQMLVCKKSAQSDGTPLPRGLLMYWDSLACPAGWGTFTAGNGRFPVGGTRSSGGYGGPALSPREDRTHTHSYSASVNQTAIRVNKGSGGADGYAASGVKSTTGNTGAASSGMPYLQLQQCEKLAAGPPKISGVVNGASFASDAIAPGEIVAIFGENIGPDSPVGSQLTGGRIPTQVADVRVLFNSTPASIFFASSGQVNAQVPYNVTGTVQVRVEYQDQMSPALPLPVATSAPGLFALNAPRENEVIAVRPDGSLVTDETPAAVGSIIVFYATGEGLTNPASSDGRPRSAGMNPIQQVTLTISGTDAEILYAGAAPGFVGLMQINARITGGTPSGKQPIKLQIGPSVSKPGTMVWIE